MTLTLNGIRRTFEGLEDGATLADLVTELGLKADRVAVEWNGEIAARSTWAAARLAGGDKVEVVHFVGGGVDGAAGEATLTRSGLHCT